MLTSMHKRLFLSHPRTVGETYFQHMKVAFSFSAMLLKLAFCAFAHGIIPACHEKSVSAKIIQLADDMKRRH